MKHGHKHHKHHSDPIVGGESEREGRPWGHGEYANMPQEVKMEAYPKMAYRDMPVLDDTEGRLETDAKAAERGFRRNLDRGMY
jgi:hypothetical protein